jgi:hypothetical protein
MKNALCIYFKKIPWHETCLLIKKIRTMVKQFFKIFYLPLLLILVLFASCKKENKVGNLTYKLKNINQSNTVGAYAPGSDGFVNRTTSGNIEWISGNGFVAEIEFEAEKDQGNTEIEYESIINRRINLFGNLVNVGSITIPPGVYEEIELDLVLRSNSTDTAFVLRGKFTNSNNQITPILFFINGTIEIETEAENVNISASSNFTALNTLNLALLSRNITETMLNNATRTGGQIIISANHNNSLYNIMLSNFHEMDDVDID